jgi:hypothetical protein
MTGILQVLLAAKAGGPINFSASCVNTLSGTTGLRSAGFTLNSDGTSSTSRSPTGGTGTSTCGPWYFPNPTAGVGALYYCKLTISSQSNTTISGAVNTVQSVSGASWSFQNSATNVEGTGSGTLTIYSDAGGTQVITSNSVGWDVGFTP